jgi:hypothetical protein
MLLIVTGVPAYLPGRSQTQKLRGFLKCFLPRIHHAFGLRQAHSLFQSQFSTQCDLVLPMSIYSIISYPEVHPIAAYVFFLVLPSLLHFPLFFLPYSVSKGRSHPPKMWPIQLALLYPTVCTIFLFSLTPCNTFPFLTRSVQLSFSILRQHHIWNFFSYFRSTFRSVQF